jgi:hypothetical protein
MTFGDAATNQFNNMETRGRLGWMQADPIWWQSRKS